MIHVFLLICITAQGLLFTNYRQYFFVQHSEVFVNTFLKEGFELLQENPRGQHTADFFFIDEVLEDVNQTVQKYYSFVEDNVDTWTYLPSGDAKQPVRMEVALWDGSLREVLHGKPNIPGEKKQCMVIMDSVVDVM